MLSPSERLRVLSRLFTRPTFSALSRSGDWFAACSFLHRYSLVRHSQAQPLWQIFETAWHQLSRGYRNEYIYKNEVANRLIFGLHSPRTAALHLELPVGRSIVDVAVFNGLSTAYEIKTEFDSARRLQTQTADYAKAFERVFVVTHPAFAQSYVDAVGDSVGVLALTPRGSLSVVKPALKSRSALEARTMFRCLRREEFLAGLSLLNPTLLAAANGRVREEALNIFQELPLEDSHEIYLRALRNRSLVGGLPDFLDQLPKCLRALGCGTPLSNRQRNSLIATLSQPVGFELI